MLYFYIDEGAFMNWQDNKLEISIITGLALTLAGLFGLFQPLNSRTNIETTDITYEMARPNSLTPGEYDLNGREIDRKYINPFEKIEDPTKPNSKEKNANNSKKIQARYETRP